MVELKPTRIRARRRIQLRLDVSLAERLEDCAERSGVSVAALVQTILEDALDGERPTLSSILRRRDAESLPALAGLWAAEEVLRAIEFNSVRRPGVEQRRDALLKAEARLEELQRHLDGEH